MEIKNIGILGRKYIESKEIKGYLDQKLENYQYNPIYTTLDFNQKDILGLIYIYPLEFVLENAIWETCKEMKIPYVSVPVNPFNVSNNLEYTLDKFIENIMWDESIKHRWD